MTGIIVKNEKFEVKETVSSIPPSSVFYESSFGSQRYILSNYNIVFIWSNKFPQIDAFQIIYKEVVLLSSKVNRMQNIADYLNKFNSISKEELEELYNEAILNEKSALELEIKELKLQKSAIKEELERYIEIQQKRNEINELIKKLDS